MRTQKLSYILVAVMVGATLLAFVPTASAQSGSIVVSMNSPTEQVKPLQGALTFSGTVTLTADYSGVANPIGIPVTYTVSNKPAWAQVLVSPASDVFPAPGAPGGVSYSQARTISVTVTASGDAPAFQAETIEITATPSPSNPQATITPGKGQVGIQAGYYSIIDVQLAEAIKVERPQSAVAFPLKITNFGNANTKVNFELISAAEGFQTVIPNPVTLQSKQAGGNQISADIPLTIQTPYKNGYMNEVGVINYKLTSSYALDPKLKGDESPVSVLITTRGFYVPGPSPILFLGMIGVIALALRRFR
jgi:hypothetical protein